MVSRVPPEMDNRFRELAEIISAPYIKANEPKKPRSAAVAQEDEALELGVSD